MAAPDSAAADEFAALQRSQISHLSHHPADSSISDSSDIDSDTSASNQTYRQTQPSLRFGNSRRRNNNVVHDEDDEDDDWDARYGGTSVFTKTGKGYEIPKGDAGRIEGNTGPKGVIADARAAEKEKFELELRKRREKSGVLGTGTHVRSEIDEEVGRKWYEDESEHEDEDEDQDEDGDESFMKEWRRKRMSEVEALARNGSRGGGSGKIEMVDALGYLEAVDGAARGRVVVVYISDSESSISRAYLSYLQTLASKYTGTRFISLDYEDAEFEYAGVPALLAYRDGEKFADMVPLRDEVPFTCNVVTNLEEALKRYGVL